MCPVSRSFTDVRQSWDLQSEPLHIYSWQNLINLHAGAVEEWSGYVWCTCERGLRAEGNKCQESQRPLFSWFQLGFVLVRVFIPAQTSWPRSKLGRKGFIQLICPHCCWSPKDAGMELKQVRKQELMQRPWRDVPYWLASTGLLSLLSYRTQDYQPSDGPTHKGPSPPWSLIEKMPSSWISWKHFPNWSSFLCDNSSLCQVDTKLASTLPNIQFFKILLVSW